MWTRLVVMENVVEAPTFCQRCHRQRDRNTIEGLYEPWLKTWEGIVCPSCLLPREGTFVDAQINGRVDDLGAPAYRRSLRGEHPLRPTFVSVDACALGYRPTLSHGRRGGHCGAPAPSGKLRGGCP